MKLSQHIAAMQALQAEIGDVDILTHNSFDELVPFSYHGYKIYQADPVNVYTDGDMPGIQNNINQYKNFTPWDNISKLAKGYYKSKENYEKEMLEKYQTQVNLLNLMLSSKPISIVF
jgi:hypothetical protein